MKFKRLFGLLLAMIMVFGLAVPAMAAEDTTQDVTIHKILMQDKVERTKFAKYEDKFPAGMTVEQLRAIPTTDPLYMGSDEVEADADYKAIVDALIVAHEDKKDSDPFDLNLLEDFSSGQWPGYTGLDGTKYTGKEIGVDIADFFGEGATEIAGVYFVFKYGEGEDNAGQYVTITKKVDADNNVTYEYGATSTPDSVTIWPGDTAEADKEYLLAGLTTADGLTLPTAGLEGNFKIHEDHSKSTYGPGELNKTKAVPVEIALPMQSETGVVEHAHVYPKNTEDKPEIDKNFAKNVLDDPDFTLSEGTEEIANAGADYINYQETKATLNAQVGTHVPYEVETLIPAQSHYNVLTWSDVMTKGLTFDKGSIKNESGELVSQNLIAYDVEGTANVTLTEGQDYFLTEDLSGFTLELSPSGFKKINGHKTALEFRFNYTATINDDAVVDVPDENDIRLDYGNQQKDDNNTFETPPGDDKTDIPVEKSWADGKVPADEENVKVMVYLYKKVDVNEWEFVDSLELAKDSENPENSWKGTFTQLDGGVEYKVIEGPVEGYSTEYTAVGPEGITITNKKDTFTPKETEIQIDKTFGDTKPEVGDEFTFDLYEITAGGAKLVATKTMKYSATASENTVKFTGLDPEKTYEIRERISGYTPTTEITEEDGKATGMSIKNEKNPGPEPLDPTEPKVVTGGKKFVKTNDKAVGATDLKRLDGAKFVVYRKVDVENDDGSTTEQIQYLTRKSGDYTTAYNEAEENYQQAYADYNRIGEIIEEHKDDDPYAIGDAQTEINEIVARAIYLKGEENAKTPFGKPEGTYSNIQSQKDLEDLQKDIKKFFEPLKKVRDEAFKKAKLAYDWKSGVTDPKEDESLVVLVSDEKGKFEIDGMQYGTYYLKEIEAPEGYALRSNDFEFEITKDSYTKEGDIYYDNDNKPSDENPGDAAQVKNKEYTIPPTGGIGTIIFTVAGLALMAIAIVAISKKRSDDLLEEN